MSVHKNHCMTSYISRGIFLLSLFTAACNSSQNTEKEKTTNTTADTVNTAVYKENVVLPPPFATESVNNYCSVTGWPAGRTPMAPQGFTVSKFADGLQNPRW